MFEARTQGAYLATIAAATEKAYKDDASLVALAQASMAGAAELVTRAPRPLTSPALGLIVAIKLLRPFRRGDNGKGKRTLIEPHASRA
ncbi:hypothetical protein PCAR4_410001 [Paraburkholderia caribensis]|nr:hypothetical protein PCAR4_410001 [Paraburkholderia caribensis]